MRAGEWCAVAALVWTAGCVQQQGFPSAVGDAYCDRLEACVPAALTEVYGSVQGCRADVVEAFEDVDGAADAAGCDWDGGRGDDCLDAVRDAPCRSLDLDALSAQCVDAYVCDDGRSLLGGDDTAP